MGSGRAACPATTKGMSSCTGAFTPSSSVLGCSAASCAWTFSQIRLRSPPIARQLQHRYRLAGTCCPPPRASLRGGQAACPCMAVGSRTYYGSPPSPPGGSRYPPAPPVSPVGPPPHSQRPALEYAQGSTAGPLASVPLPRPGPIPGSLPAVKRRFGSTPALVGVVNVP